MKILNKLIKNILRKFGYLKCDYGFSCGRHYIVIDGLVIAQSTGDDVWLKDEDVHRMGYVLLDKGKFWTKPTPMNKGENFHINTNDPK